MCMCICVIYIYIYTKRERERERPGLWGKNIPFTQVFALQNCSRNCFPAPDLVLRKLILPHMLSSPCMYVCMYV